MAPIVQGIAGFKSNTLNTTEGSCFVKSFLPQQVVNDTIAFNLELITSIGLQSLTLERLTNGIFVPVQTINAGNELALTFTDPEPKPGRNEYRVRITTQKLGVFYNQV